MMFHQSMSRSQRARGSRAKSIFQVAVLLAVVVWLLYQTKHSYDKKPEYAEAEYIKLSEGDMNIQFGRKVNAGSENVISIDPHGKNPDETADAGEAREIEVDQDVFGDEEKAEEVGHESEGSQEDITDSGKEEALHEQAGNVDDNVDHHNASKVNTEAMQDDLRLPSQRDGGSFDQTEKQTKDVRSSEETGLPNGDATPADGSNITDGEKIKSDEAMLITANQAENGENTKQQSEMGKAGSEHGDSAVHVAQELTNSSVYDDQSNQDMSVDNDSHEETVKPQEATGSDAEITHNNTIEEARTNARSDVNSYAEVARPDGSSEDGSDNFPKSMDENNVVMPDSNGAPGGEEGELQTDITTEGQATGNYSIEAVTADTNSEGENAILPNSSEENGTVMSDNNGVPKEVVVQPEMGRVSEGEKVDNNSSEETKADKSDSEVLEKEANASDAEAATAVTVEKENDRKLIDEAANSSFTINKEHAELPENAKVQSHGNTGSVAENTSKSSLEEERSDNLLAKSAENNEQNNSDLPTSEIPNEEVASHEDNTFKVESASKNVEDATGEVETQSNDVMASVLGNNTELSSGNITAEVQKGSTGSESSEL